MKLLSVGLARSLWYMDVGELNPSGKDIFTEVVPALVEDYKFTIVPKPGDDFKDGMKFARGVFTNSKGDTLAGSLTLWSDGVAADTYSSTEDSDEFIREALESLPLLGFNYDPEVVRRKAHLSQVNVRCSKDLSSFLNPKILEFARKISSATQTPFDFSAFEFWPDQGQLSRPANFSFQRKVGDLSGDRYWSQAGLSTDQHLELLEELEALLS